MANFLAAFVVAAGLSLVTTPLVCRLAIKKGWLKQPVGRSVHTAPIPHLGGLALIASFVVAIALLGATHHSGFLPLMGGAAVIVLIGILDDLYGLPAKVKLMGQIAAALVLTVGGVRIEWITNPLGGMWYAGTWAIPVTVLWVVAVVNTVNLIDGLDGLASGLSLIAAMAMFVIALHEGEPGLGVLCLAFVGANAGFLWFNFNPARIFMGDVGAMFLGYILASLAIMGTVKDATTLTLGAPVLALALPLFDTAFAMIRRVRAGRPIMSPDRGHVHHRLLDIGCSQRKAVMILYAVATLFAAAAVVLVVAPEGFGILLAVAILAALIVLGAHYGVLGGTVPQRSMGKDISS